ncbi:MAG TPA: PHP domain-containing protein [Candidatus Dormibacteraeota bacterium]
MSPDEAAAYLAEIAYHLRGKEDQHRARAFSKVAASLLRDRPDLEALNRAGKLETLPGVGAGIAKVLRELVAENRSAYLERLREESGEPSAVPAQLTPLVEQGYQGDLHSHSNWSDGGATVLEMALAAQARGYHYLGITDHSPMITVVNGLGPERLAAQRRVIDEAQARLGPDFTIFQGIEVDILPDGKLDLDDDTLAGLDVVIASPHLQLRMEPAQMTERMLRAVEHPHVDVIGHPTGRRPGSRAGATYDFEKVFSVAARNGVLLEVDCDPARMDLSPELARQALALGCRFALDSDAHYVDQFVYVDLALWMTRKAGIPTERIVNWLPAEGVRKEFE